MSKFDPFYIGGIVDHRSEQWRLGKKKLEEWHRACAIKRQAETDAEYAAKKSAYERAKYLRRKAKSGKAVRG